MVWCISHDTNHHSPTRGSMSTYQRRADLDTQTRIKFSIEAYRHQGIYGKMTEIAKRYPSILERNSYPSRWRYISEFLQEQGSSCLLLFSPTPTRLSFF